MPTENRLTVSGEGLEQMLASVVGVDEDGSPVLFDFDQIRPTPQSLLDGGIWNETEEFEQLEDAFKETGAGGAAYERFQLEHRGFVQTLMLAQIGHTAGWWEWRENAWGTGDRINAGEDELLQDGSAGVFELVFSTSTAPVAVISALAARHPQLRFELVYANVDQAYAGRVCWNDGMIESRVECDETEAAALLDEHWPLAGERFHEANDDDPLVEP